MSTARRYYLHSQQVKDMSALNHRGRSYEEYSKSESDTESGSDFSDSAVEPKNKHPAARYTMHEHGHYDPNRHRTQHAAQVSHGPSGTSDGHHENKHHHGAHHKSFSGIFRVHRSNDQETGHHRERSHSGQHSNHPPNDGHNLDPKLHIAHHKASAAAGQDLGHLHAAANSTWIERRVHINNFANSPIYPFLPNEDPGDYLLAVESHIKKLGHNQVIDEFTVIFHNEGHNRTHVGSLMREHDGSGWHLKQQHSPGRHYDDNHTNDPNSRYLAGTGHQVLSDRHNIHHPDHQHSAPQPLHFQKPTDGAMKFDFTHGSRKPPAFGDPHSQPHGLDRHNIHHPDHQHSAQQPLHFQKPTEGAMNFDFTHGSRKPPAFGDHDSRTGHHVPYSQPHGLDRHQTTNSDHHLRRKHSSASIR